MGDMKNIALCIAALCVLASCGKPTPFSNPGGSTTGAPPASPSPSATPTPPSDALVDGTLLTQVQLRKLLADGLVWCYDPQASTKSCSSVERLNFVGSEDFSIRKFVMINLSGNLIKLESIQTLVIRGDQACSTSSAEIATMRVYQGGSAVPAIGANDQYNERASIAFRTVMANEAERNGTLNRENCFGWRVMTSDPPQIMQLNFVGGVQQPDDSPTNVRLYPMGTDDLRLTVR
jgi:hypothetical protein